MLERGGEVLTVYFRCCVREVRCRCLCCTPNQTSSRSFMRREAAAFWLCHLPHQHHFQAPAMHLSVAERVQGGQAHEGHGAAPALLAVSGSAGNVLCAGDQEHPAQPQGWEQLLHQKLVSFWTCVKTGLKGTRRAFWSTPESKNSQPLLYSL